MMQMLQRRAMLLLLLLHLSATLLPLPCKYCCFCTCC
tara:strand:+ start:365 stop:475 length:111 start_codon:yes stop_codon:yes gene_type:complete